MREVRPKLWQMHRTNVRSTSVHVLVVLMAAACGGSRGSSAPAESPPAASEAGCRDGAADDVKMAGRTARAAAKTGLTAAADGIVQAGSSVAGLVEGGKDEAKQRWKDGGAQTREDARKGAAETKQAASVPRCSK